MICAEITDHSILSGMYRGVSVPSFRPQVCVYIDICGEKKGWGDKDYVRK